MNNVPSFTDCKNSNQGDKPLLYVVYCFSTDHPLTFPPTGQWHLTPTQPAPATPPPRPPAPSTPPTTTPGTTWVLQPRLSHWIGASGRPTSPQEGPQQRGDMWPLWAGPHQGSRVVEIQRLTVPGSSRLRNTEPGTGRSSHILMNVFVDSG